MVDIFNGFSRQADDKEDIFAGFSTAVEDVTPVVSPTNVETPTTVRSKTEQPGEDIFAGFSRTDEVKDPTVVDDTSALGYLDAFVKDVPGPLAYGAVATLPAIAMQHMTVASQKIQQGLGLVPKMTPQQQAEFGEKVAYNIQTLGGLLEPETEEGKQILGVISKPFELLGSFAHWTTQGIDKEVHPNAHNLAASGVELFTLGVIPAVGKKVTSLAKSRIKVIKSKGKAKQDAAVKVAKEQAELNDIIESVVKDGTAETVVSRYAQEQLDKVQGKQVKVNKEQKIWVNRQRAIQAELEKHAPAAKAPLDPLVYPEKLLSTGVKARTAAEQAVLKRPLTPFEKPPQIDPITGRPSEGKVYRVGEDKVVPEIVDPAVPTTIIDPVMRLRKLQQDLAKGIQPERVPLEPLTYPEKPLRSGVSAQTALERAAMLEHQRVVSEPIPSGPKGITEPIAGVKPPIKKPIGAKHVTEELVPRKTYQITKEGTKLVEDVSAKTEIQISRDGVPITTSHIPTQRSVFQIIKKPKKTDVKPVQLDMLEGVISNALSRVKAIGKFDKDFTPVAYEKLKPSQRGVQAIWKELFDRDVIFFDSKNIGSSKVRGFMDPASPNQIYVNAKTRRPALNIAGHELVHSMEAMHPELFNWMKTELDVLVKQKGYKQFLEEKGYYKERGRDPGKEFYPEMMAEVMNKKSFWDKLLAKDKPKAIRIMDWLVNLLSRIKNFTRKEGLETYFKDVDKVVDVMAKASKDIKKTVSDLKAPHESSILYDMAKESNVDKVRVVGIAAEKAGLSLPEFLKSKGLSDKDVNAFMRVHEKAQIEKPFKSAEPEIKSSMKGDVLRTQEGETVVNVGKKSNPKVPIGERLLSEIQKIPRMEATPLVSNFRTALRTFDKLRSPAMKELYHWYKDNNFIRFKQARIIEKQIKELSKEFNNKKLREEAGIYAHARSESGKKAMLQQGERIPESVEYSGLVNKMEGNFQELFEKINDMRVSIGKRPIKAMVDEAGKNVYMPFFAKESFYDRIQEIFNKEGLEGEARNRVSGHANLVTDSMDQILYRHKPSTVDAAHFAHTSRGKVFKGTKIETDPIKLYAKYSSTALDHIHMSPINAFIKELTTKTLTDPKTGKDYRMWLENEELGKFLGSWSNHISGVPNLITNKYLDKAARVMSKNLTAATLLYAPRTILAQVTALLPTATEFGYKKTSKGIADTIVRKKVPAIERSRELKPRVADPYLEAIAEQFAGTVYEKGKAKVYNIGSAGIRFMDYVAAEATWRTAYDSVKGKLNESEAIIFADEAVVRTQGSGAKGDLSPIQMNAIGKAATLWQTFTIGNANFIATDVLGIKNPNLKPMESAKRVARYVAGSAMISTIMEDMMGIQSTQPAPIKAIIAGLEEGDNAAAIALSTMLELGEAVPIVGSLKFGSHPGGPVLEYFGDVAKVLSGNDVFYQDLLPKAIAGDKRSMLKVVEMIGKGVGMPGTATLSKLVRGVERGESIPGALIGRYTEPKKKTVSRRRRRVKRPRRPRRSYAD